MKLYKKFKRRYSVNPCDEDSNSLGSHRPMIMNCQLGYLKRIADKGNLDGWMDYVDSELTYWENKTKLKEKVGATGHSSPFESDREKWVEKMLSKQEEYEERTEEEGEEQRAREEMYRSSMR